ncbi:uncharacterized protein [Chironomus tepperi]|uniref:uncharacterized protein n=1 Tax=Chironomus tepperi TaxID=113505 RepID=UPI00391F37AA
MHGQHKNINDMRIHIKRALNIRSENSTLDEYISKVFNLQNLNPTYVFRMPDGNNRTLTFRKSDFISPVFPNITSISNLESKRHQVNMKTEEILDELRHEKLIFQKNLDGNYEDVDYDDNMKNIVQENVKTEKDFETLLNELNEDLDYEDQLKKKDTKTTIVKDEWSELGLDGWSGLMTSSKDNLPKKVGSNQTSKKHKTALIPFAQNADPLTLLNLKQPSRNHRKPQKQEITSNESALEMEEYVDQITTILLENEKILRNKTGRIPNVRWPVTTSRDQHRDDDIFIGRANNPFGHSTKWKYRNSSDDGSSHREGRSKRGVLHLYSMIKCATGCDPLQYKGYGCYCGFLGSGRALDGIDRCCKAHDLCYSNANCFFYTEYLVPYLWKCYRGKPLCAFDNGEFGGPFSCATKLCECDRALSKCLRHYYCPRKRPVCTSNPFRLLQNLVMVF